MREKYTTSLEPTLIKALKYQSIDEKRPVNKIIAEAIETYLKVYAKKGEV